MIPYSSDVELFLIYSYYAILLDRKTNAFCDL